MKINLRFAIFSSAYFFGLVGCVSTTKMYDEFQKSARTNFNSPQEVFKTVQPSKIYELEKRTTIELVPTDPVLMLDPETNNRGYFKVVQFEVKQADTYTIKGIVNCRCFGKVSGKNAVVARLFLFDKKTGKVTGSVPGITVEHISFVEGDQWVNRLEANLSPGVYSLIIAADNAKKGDSIFSIQSYGPVPLTVDISSSPDGKVDLQILSKAPKPEPKEESGEKAQSPAYF